MENAWIDHVTMNDMTDAQKEFAEVIGVKETLLLCDAYGGGTIYIPKDDEAYNRIVRNPKVKKMYQEGATARMIAKTFGVSLRTIMRILLE